MRERGIFGGVERLSVFGSSGGAGMSKNFDLRPYSINDFNEWSERRELILSPKFQRRRVWSDKAKSYLIDTILRGLPIPPVFIRQQIDLKNRKTKSIG